VGDIFREIDEELRQEKLERLWKAYGTYIIAGAVGIVLAVAGFRGWQEYRSKQLEAESAQYMAAVNLVAEGKSQDAAALFAALADKSGDAYGGLARFHQAALKAKAGDRAGAIASYDALARDEGLSRPLRDAAVTLSVMHAMDQPDVDARTLAERLEPLVAGGGAWRNVAGELSALLALKAGDSSKAKERFKAIADDADAPANIRARAAEMLAVLGG